MFLAKCQAFLHQRCPPLFHADPHPQSARALRDTGLLQLDLTGFVPISGCTWTTSFFFHRAFDFPPRRSQQPAAGIGCLGIVAPET
jgi:hypothetical protein